jgi:hypothetical protein
MSKASRWRGSTRWRNSIRTRSLILLSSIRPSFLVKWASVILLPVYRHIYTITISWDITLHIPHLPLHIDGSRSVQGSSLYNRKLVNTVAYAPL